MAGVAAAYDTNDNGYAFAMNTFYPASTYVPMVRYDQSYARAVGKWVLNIANNARYFMRISGTRSIRPIRNL